MEKRRASFLAPIITGWTIGMIVCAMVLTVVAGMKQHQTSYLLFSIPNQNVSMVELQRSILSLAWQAHRQELCIVGVGLLLPFLFAGIVYWLDRRRPLTFLQARVVQVLLVLTGFGAIPVILSCISRLLPGLIGFAF
jgi:hypothetical protein